MERKPIVVGTLIYGGLLLFVGVFLFLFGSLFIVPIPWWYVLVGSAVTVFFGTVILQSLGKGTFASFSITAGGLYLIFSTLLCFSIGAIAGLVFQILGGFFAVAWLITAGGVWVAKRITSRGLFKRARKHCAWASVAVIVVTVLGLYLIYIGSEIYSSIRSARLTAPALRCNAEELSATKVVPELNVPVIGETNLIWCAPFQLAWNEMADFLGEEVRFGQKEPDCVSYLNQRSTHKEHLDGETYFAAAGAYTADFIRELNAEVRSSFCSGTFAPEPLPEGDGEGRLAAFAYLSVNLPFKHAFQRTDYPLSFKGVPVKAFTIPFGDGAMVKADHAKRQVQICYPPEEGAFIVELITKETDHHLILATVSPEATLAKTVDKVSGYVDSLPQEYLEMNQALVVPLFNFDITREYTELTGHTLAVENPTYRDWIIEKAGQNIRFQLDERGAVLQSSAFMIYAKCIPPIDCIFDEPFLLMLRYKDSAQPYFVLWVDNAEILVKSE